MLQESLLAAARELSGFRSESSLSTWLYTISRYLEGDISARTCRRMEDHLASCDALRRVLHLCRTTPSPDVPPALQERVRAAILRAIQPKA